MYRKERTNIPNTNNNSHLSCSRQQFRPLRTPQCCLSGLEMTIWNFFSTWVCCAGTHNFVRITQKLLQLTVIKLKVTTKTKEKYFKDIKTRTLWSEVSPKETRDPKFRSAECCSSKEKSISCCKNCKILAPGKIVLRECSNITVQKWMSLGEANKRMSGNVTNNILKNWVTSCIEKSIQKYTKYKQ